MYFGHIYVFRPYGRFTILKSATDLQRGYRGCVSGFNPCGRNTYNIIEPLIEFIKKKKKEEIEVETPPIFSTKRPSEALS